VARFSFNNSSRLDEITGKTARLVGTRFTRDRFGNANNAVYLFGNEDSYVNLGDYPALKPQVGSISLWVKIELEVFAGKGIYINPVLITKNSNYDDFFEGYGIYYAYETDRIQATCTLDSLRQVSLYGMSKFTRFEWHHLVITFNDDSLSFFIDGEMEGRLPKKFKTKFQAGDSVLLGATGNEKNNRFLNGIIDDIAFYDRVLGQNEVRDLYHAPNPNRLKVLVYWMIALLGSGLLIVLIYFFVKYRLSMTLKKEKQKLELDNLVLETELRVNRALMNPHFVFNSLNALQNFILKNENENANNYLVKFSKLMRKILESNLHDSVTLEEEIELLIGYLDIEELRFEENIKYQVYVDPEVQSLTIRIPIMMLQPFIENTLWHGLLKKEGEKTIKISFGLKDDKYVECVIDDNGIGRKKTLQAALEKRSLATGFVIQRLDLLNRLYDLDCRLTIEDKPNDQGTIVRILLPIINKIQHDARNNN
jgi:hypothetical protein